MPAGRRTWAYRVAMLGSAGMLISLWLPWYLFRIPAAAIDQAAQLSQQFGILGPLLRQGAELARTLGPVHLTGWQALQQADILIAIQAVIAGGAAMLASNGQARGAGRGIRWAGGTALIVIGYRTAMPPGPDGFLHTSWAAYLALACGAAVFAAGCVAAADEAQPEWRPPEPKWRPVEPVPGAQRSAWEAAGSVAPPRV